MTTFPQLAEVQLRKNPFWCSCIAWYELKDKMFYDQVESVLMRSVRLADYGNDVIRIVFIFIADLPNSMHKERTFYSPKKQTLHLELALDYSRFALASPQEAKLMMAELYLEAIKTYPKIRGMKKIAFDHEQFYADVRNLFEKEGWLNAL
jgi:hypothetical protein